MIAVDEVATLTAHPELGISISDIGTKTRAGWNCSARRRSRGASMRVAAVLVLFFSCLAFAYGAVSRGQIDFAHVRELAARRAAAPPKTVRAELPPRLAELTYDDYRKLEFRRDAALWRGAGLPFQAHFFPRGGLFKDLVKLHEFSATHVQEIPFDPSWYAIGEINGVRSLPRDLGFAGFKLLHPLNRRDAFDEVVSFLGASYFRAVGAGQQYGLSARGLARDAAITGKQEEFPRFSEFWLGRPTADASTFKLYALLEGETVTGAYEFVVTPGVATIVDVRAILFFRTGDKVTGVAPLTSMFWYGENTRRPDAAKRSEVHDSDGLFVEHGGTRIWRPLRNPAGLETVDIAARELIRFGLLQRDREKSHYGDEEADYDRRPSAWIEPQGEWAAGKVRLVQLPTKDEYADNVVAYWVADAQPSANETREVRYRIVWSMSEPAGSAPARVVATRQEARGGGAPGAAFQVAFQPMNSRAGGAAAVVPEIEVGRGARLVDSSVQSDAQHSLSKLSFQVEPMGSAPVELRCRLRDSEGAFSETWLYTWNP